MRRSSIGLLQAFKMVKLRCLTVALLENWMHPWSYSYHRCTVHWLNPVDCWCLLSPCNSSHHRPSTVDPFCIAAARIPHSSRWWCGFSYIWWREDKKPPDTLLWARGAVTLPTGSNWDWSVSSSTAKPADWNQLYVQTTWLFRQHGGLWQLWLLVSSVLCQAKDCTCGRLVLCCLSVANGSYNCFAMYSICTELYCF